MIETISLENIFGFRCGAYPCDPKLTIFIGGPARVNLHSILAFAFKVHDNTPQLKDPSSRFMISIKLDGGMHVIRSNKGQGLFKKNKEGKLEKQEWPTNIDEEQFDSAGSWHWPGSADQHIKDRLGLLKDEKFKFVVIRTLDEVLEPDQMIRAIVSRYPKQIITTARVVGYNNEKYTRSIN